MSTTRTIGLLVPLLAMSISPALGNDYYPLKEGNNWTFSLPTGGEMTITVAGLEDVKGVKCARLECDLADQGKTTSWLVADTDGVWTYKFKNPQGEIEFPKPLLQIKLPFKPGDKWQAQLPRQQSIDTQMESVGREMIKVPVGTFECIRIDTVVTVGEKKATTSTWYADGVGQVQMTATVGGRETTMQLTRTNVGPAAKPAVAIADTSKPSAIPTANRFCLNCGVKVPVNAKFCPECGAKIPLPPASAAPVAPAIPPVSSASLAPSTALTDVVQLQQATLLDPNSNHPAFTMLAPPTWKAACSIAYRGDRPADPVDVNICARSPDGQAEFNMVPNVWSTWSPIMAQMGMLMPRNPGNEAMQCPDKAAEFFKQLVLPRLRPELRQETRDAQAAGQYKVVDIQDYPKIAEAQAKSVETMAKTLLASGSKLNIQVARIRVEYTNPKTGQQMQEDIGGTLTTITSVIMGLNGPQIQSVIWRTNRVFACRAVKGQLERYVDLFACMAGSVRPDPAWLADYQQAVAIMLKGQADNIDAAAERAKVMAAAGAEQSKIICDTYQHTAKVLNQSADQFDRAAIRGTALYKSPYEDYSIELPAGYDYVWTSGKGQYRQSNDALYDPNVGSSVRWEQIRRTP